MGRLRAGGDTRLAEAPCRAGRPVGGVRAAREGTAALV